MNHISYNRQFFRVSARTQNEYTRNLLKCLQKKVRAPEHENRGEASCMRRIRKTLAPRVILSSVITASAFAHKYGLNCSLPMVTGSDNNISEPEFPLFQGTA